MKNHKNIFLSLAFYVVALACYFYLVFIPNISSNAVFIPTLVLILVGLFFGFRSINAKESKWAGHLVVIIGGVILISPLLILMAGYGAL